MSIASVRAKSRRLNTVPAHPAQSLDACLPHQHSAGVTLRLVPKLRDLTAGWRGARLAGALLFALGGRSLEAQSTGLPYVWTTLAGNATAVAGTTTRVDGNGAVARFAAPAGIALESGGSLVVGDSGNHSIRRVSAAGVVSTVAGLTTAGFEDGFGTGPTGPRFNGPQGVAVDAAGNMYVADTGNHVIRQITTTGGNGTPVVATVSTIAGRAGLAGFGDGTLGFGRLNGPRGVAADGNGNLFITDTGNHLVRKLDTAGQLIVVAGQPGAVGSADGTVSSARFQQPWGIVVDATGNIFVSDSGNATIRRISAAGVVTTVAGLAGSPGNVDGVGTAARFAQPAGLALDSVGNLFVADAGNHTIRKVTPAGVVSTVGGSAGRRGASDGLSGAALFAVPVAVAIDASGSLFVADQDNNLIRAGYVPRPPTITAQPTSVTVSNGVGATFTVSANSLVSMTYQWSLNGTAISGATGASYTIASAQARDAGGYTVAVSNLAGTTTSAAAVLAVSAPPVITLTPSATSLGTTGAAAQLFVTAVGTGPFGFQWFRDGQAIPGSNSPVLSSDVAGSYVVVVSNNFGSVTSVPVRVEYPNRLVNLSTRGTVGNGAGSLVAGLVVQAPAGTTKALLVRAIGPALRSFGLDGVVAQTALAITDASGATVASNQGWLNNSNLPQLDAATHAAGAFPLQPSSGDSAVLVNLAGGVYTVSVGAVGGATGTGLVEIYEVGADTSRLVNLSTRGVITATSGLTAGVVVAGAVPTKLLVRAVGPGLTQFGVNGALTRPQLTVFNGATQIASNAGWAVQAGGSSAAALAEAATSAGAFPLATGSDDAALLLTNLAPGNYTAIVTGVNGATGSVLIEVYQVP